MEKRIYRKKCIAGLSVCVVIDIINIFACYTGLIKMYRNDLISELEFNENIIIGDYHTSIEYGVVQMVVYLLFIHMIVKTKRVEEMIRYKNRNRYWKTLYGKVGIITALFTVIHELVGIFFLLLYGNFDLIVKHGWLYALCFQLLASFLYYMMVYFVYEICFSKFGNVALITTIVLQALTYYVSVAFVGAIWIPADEVALMRNICIGEYTISQAFFAIVKLVESALLLGVVSFWVKQGEDLLIYEKES